MKKSQKIITGVSILIAGILTLGADRLFVSASSVNYTQSVTVLTTVSILLLLIGAVVLFKSTYNKD